MSLNKDKFEQLLVKYQRCWKQTVKRFNDHTVFVRFKAACGASCKTENLVWG